MDELAARLPEDVKIAAGVNLAVAELTASVVRALQEAGVRPIVLKGPIVSEWLYGDYATRMSGDVDLLVSPKQLLSAETVLSKRGLAAFPDFPDWPQHSQMWLPDHPGITVDLHRTLWGIPLSNGEAWAGLAAETQWVTIRGVPAETLAPPGRALHLALHAAQHGRAEELPLADLARALDTFPSSLWEDAAALAGRLRASEAFAAGLDLLPQGKALRRSLGLSEPHSVEVLLQMQSPPLTALGFHQLASVPGLPGKARYIVRKLTMPPPWMRRVYPLARRGRLGLVATYAWRPFWLALHAGRGFTAWRRARRRVEG